MGLWGLGFRVYGFMGLGFWVYRSCMGFISLVLGGLWAPFWSRFRLKIDLGILLATGTFVGFFQRFWVVSGLSFGSTLVSKSAKWI